MRWGEGEWSDSKRGAEDEERREGDEKKEEDEEQDEEGRAMGDATCPVAALTDSGAEAMRGLAVGVGTRREEDGVTGEGRGTEEGMRRGRDGRARRGV